MDLGAEVDVIRNDSIDFSKLAYDGVVLSPGPGLPSGAGQLMALIEQIAEDIPILGVCLGMQAIAEFLGGEIYNQMKVKHGVEEQVLLYESPLFSGLNKEITVGLYHSWAVVPESNNYHVIAESRSGVVMAIQNEQKKMYGVQFHPESVMTPEGKKIIKNFLNLLAN